MSALAGDDEADCGVSGKNSGGEAGSRPNGEYVIAAVVAIWAGDGWGTRGRALAKGGIGCRKA